MDHSDRNCLLPLTTLLFHSKVDSLKTTMKLCPHNRSVDWHNINMLCDCIDLYERAGLIKII